MYPVGMAISHICLRCGMDLARVRAVPDPHYRLPVAVCPGCGGVTVRRPDAIVMGYRRARRLFSALLALGAQAVVGAGLLTAQASITYGIVRECRDMQAAMPDLLAAMLGRGGNERLTVWIHESDGLMVLIMWTCMCVGAGLWLTAGLAHLSRIVWPVWTALLLAVTCLDRFIRPVQLAFAWCIGVEPPAAIRHVDLADRVTLALAGVAIATLGIPLGRGLRRLEHARRRHGRTRLRSRLRRLRQGHAA
jgi:hypothetical protein